MPHVRLLSPRPLESFQPEAGIVGSELLIKGKNMLNVMSGVVGGVEAEIILKKNKKLVVIVPAGPTLRAETG